MKKQYIINTAIVNGNTDLLDILYESDKEIFEKNKYSFISLMKEYRFRCIDPCNKDLKMRDIGKVKSWLINNKLYFPDKSNLNQLYY